MKYLDRGNQVTEAQHDEQQADRDTQIRRRDCDLWLVRGRTAGILSKIVEIWWSRPEFEEYADGTVIWLGLDPEDNTKTTLMGRWTLGQCQAEFGTYPDDARQCIHVGHRKFRPIIQKTEEHSPP